MNANKQFLLALVLGCLMTISCSTNRVKIVHKGTSEYQIIVSEKADSLTMFAASSLQNYISKMTNTSLSIVKNGKVNDKSIILSQSSTQPYQNYEPSITSEDGFVIKSLHKDLILVGGSEKGILYAVYTLLEQWGCRYYTPEDLEIPHLKTLYLPEFDLTENPIITHRECNFVNHFTQEFMDWHKLDDHRQEFGMWVHTFDDLIPAETYFENHPEYFSLLNGKRISNGQLCLSNPDVLSQLNENLRKEIKANPEYTHWSVSQNDHYNACSCENCQKEYELYGGYSGALINFVNKVAAEFPDKTISTLAYQYTREAPANITPAENVNIVLCTIEFNRSMPLAEDPRSKAFVKDLDDWANLTDNILIWDYTVQYRNLVSPFPNFDVLQPNIQFFTQHGATKMFQQASGTIWSDLRELKQYTIAKLLWNPDVNTDSIQTEFLQAYYGDASEYIKEYKDILHNELDSVKEDYFLNIYGYPHDAVETFLTPELLNTYSILFDKAEQAEKDQPEILKRVQKTRLPLEFAILDISLQNVNDTLRYVFNNNGEFVINQSLKDRLNQFSKRAKEFGITKLEEHGLPPNEYQAMVNDYIAKSMIQNMAFQKKVKAISPCSSKYNKRGIDALTDGLFGLKDFNINFLGWQGNHLEIIIDLEEIKSIQKISADFLQDGLAWIFLPKHMEVWTSTNGSDWEYRGFDDHQIDSKIGGRFTEGFQVEIDPVMTRFVKVKATSLLECPQWHVGANNPCWIFTDEIVVE